MKNFASEHAKIQKEIDRLNKQAQLLQSKQRKPAIATIIRSMKDNNITPEEIAAAFGKTGTKPSKTTVAKTAKTPSTRKPVAPKYRNPSSAATWTGRGKAPLWIVEAEKNGQTRAQFLI